MKGESMTAVFRSNVVGITQVAERAGVTPGAVQKWRQRYEAFPAPFANVGTEASPHPVWDWLEVESWLSQR